LDQHHQLLYINYYSSNALFQDCLKYLFIGLDPLFRPFLPEKTQNLLRSFVIFPVFSGRALDATQWHLAPLIKAPIGS